MASLMGETISMPLAKSVVRNMVRARKAITMETIQNQVCKAFGIKRKEILSRSRKKQIALARQVAMYLARSLTDSSLKVIGGEFGGRDHSTVIHACDLISKKMAIEPTFRERIDQISASLLY